MWGEGGSCRGSETENARVRKQGKGQNGQFTYFINEALFQFCQFTQQKNKNKNVNSILLEYVTQLALYG